MEDDGLKSPSAHFRGVASQRAGPTRIEWAQAIGMTQMNTASMGGRMATV